MKRTVSQSVFDSAEARKIQKIAHREACEELARQPRHMLGEGNPNHPIYDDKLFGYDVGAFMAKQYK